MMEENFHLSEFEINNSKIIKTATIFPFGLEEDMDRENIMNTNSTKALENLPSYEITSKAISFDALKGNDLNENLIYNINSHYYSAYEFQSLEFKDSIFSILT